jgi:hypothetical protein
VYLYIPKANNREKWAYVIKETKVCRGSYSQGVSKYISQNDGLLLTPLGVSLFLCVFVVTSFMSMYLGLVKCEIYVCMYTFSIRIHNEQLKYNSHTHTKHFVF